MRDFSNTWPNVKRKNRKLAVEEFERQEKAKREEHERWKEREMLESRQRRESWERKRDGIVTYEDQEEIEEIRSVRLGVSHQKASVTAETTSVEAEHSCAEKTLVEVVEEKFREEQLQILETEVKATSGKSVREVSELVFGDVSMKTDEKRQTGASE